jgi:beta-mannosidase
MHDLRIESWSGKTLLSIWEDKVGFREIRLDQSANSDGKAFTFVLNDSVVFAKGVNMVPPSMFPTAANHNEWIALVKRMREANMNMVRLWAGGVYPPEVFYDACDTAGIMVWQDIMLANMAPGNREFSQNVQVEVENQMMKIQHHPCVVLYCGNNELDVAWNNWGWQKRYGLHGEDSTIAMFHHRGLFQVHIPAAIDLFAGDDVPYTPTSPLSNWGNAEGLKNGDLHYWGVWHGDSAFSSFKNNVGRFVSEYGFQSYPDSALLAKYMDPKELYLGSPAMERLQRSYKTDKPIWDAIERELGEEKPTTLGGFINASQRAQAKAYGMAIEAHMAAQPHCMGTLLWQLNDCWPGPSWSIIDYEGKPKPAFEVVKRLYDRTP